MSFDALTLSAVRDELEPLLTGSRIQRLVFVDELTLAVECFRSGAGRTCVLLSAHPEHGRVQRIETLPARGLERDTPFALLARKHLRAARLSSISQPPLERVLELDCEQHDASGEHYRVLLIVEAMGRRGNLVLVGEDGTILDAARRSPPSRNPRRPVLPHLPYAPPPPQERLLPESVSAAALTELARGRGGPLARFLSDTLAGLSPLTGRELAFTATGVPDAALDDTDLARVADAVKAFLAPLETHVWTPTVALRDGDPQAFAPYELTHLAAAGASVRAFTSISEAMAVFYAADRPAARGDALAGERAALLPPLDKALASTERRLYALETQLASSASQRDAMRSAGELLLSHQHEVPAEASEVVLDGVAVTLDPTLTVVENAQAYFARYRKAREAQERVPELLEEARQQLDYLRELRTLVEVADQMDAIRALRREVAGATGAGGSDKQRRGAPSARPGAGYRRVPLVNGWEALVGTSATSNAYVTFDAAQPDDLWLHARGVPGAHVIVRHRGSADPPEEVISSAAQLAAWHSAARANARVEVDVARRRYVKKIPNAPPGLVRYTHERTLRVEPRA